MANPELTNDELLNRIRAQTDMIQFVQKQADELESKLDQLKPSVQNAFMNSIGARTIAESALKADDTTQKLLKELIQEIKLLREDGDVQQKQIDSIRKELNQLKEMNEIMNENLKREIEIVRNEKSYPHVTLNGWGYGHSGGGWSEYNDGVTMTVQGNENGHVGIYEEQDTTQFTCMEQDDSNVDAKRKRGRDRNLKTPPTPKTYT